MFKGVSCRVILADGNYSPVLQLQELRKLLRKVHSTQEQEGRVSSEGNGKPDATVVSARRSLDHFLRGLVKQLPVWINIDFTFGCLYSTPWAQGRNLSTKPTKLDAAFAMSCVCGISKVIVWELMSGASVLLTLFWYFRTRVLFFAGLSYDYMFFKYWAKILEMPWDMVWRVIYIREWCTEHQCF